MRVLVTRAIEDGLALQAELLGFDVTSVLAPMLSIEYFNPVDIQPIAPFRFCLWERRRRSD